jgi:serine O-acetyltransferase
MHHFAHCWISVAAEIGPGLLIAHVSGVIIGGGTIIGKNCDIRQNVTFGGNFNKSDENGRQQPMLGDNISIGAGAVIIGPVSIGNNSIVGANSVVTKDVPSRVIVFGIPAIIVKDVWDENITGRKL